MVCRGLVIAQHFLHAIIELLLLSLEGVIAEEAIGHLSSSGEDLLESSLVLTRVGYEVPSELAVATYQR